MQGIDSSRGVAAHSPEVGDFSIAEYRDPALHWRCAEVNESRWSLMKTAIRRRSSFIQAGHSRSTASQCGTMEERAVARLFSTRAARLNAAIECDTAARSRRSCRYRNTHIYSRKLVNHGANSRSVSSAPLSFSSMKCLRRVAVKEGKCLEVSAPPCQAHALMTSISR